MTGGPMDAGELLAEGFAAHVAQWARGAGAGERDTAIASACARRASLATQQGHVCTTLELVAQDDQLGTPNALREALVRSGVAGTPDEPGARPLVLDAEGRVYLHRYYD